MFRFLSDSIKTHFVHSVVIALSAALLCIETLVLSGCEANFAFEKLLPYLVLLICLTFFVYNFHQLFLMPATLFKGFVATNFWTFIFLVSLSSGVFFYSQLVNSNYAEWFVLLSAIAALITFIYIDPFEKINIRKWFLFKNMSLIIVFSIATVLLPLLYSSHTIFDTGTRLIFARRFLFIAALLIPFEIRDVKKDEANRNSNIAITLGINFSKLISIFFLLIFTGLAFYQFGFQSFFNVLIASAAMSAVLVLIYSSSSKYAKPVLLLIDSMMLIQALLVIFIG